MYRITNFTAESEEKATNFKDMDEALKETTCNPDVYSIEQMDGETLLGTFINLHQVTKSLKSFKERSFSSWPTQSTLKLKRILLRKSTE
jgi:hypothetical protein